MRIKAKYLNKDGSVNESKMKAKAKEILSPSIDRVEAYIKKTINKRFTQGKNSDDGSNFEDIKPSTQRWRRYTGGGNVDGKPLNFTGSLGNSNKVVRRGLNVDIVNSNPYSQGLNEGFTGKRGGGTQTIPARKHLDVPDEVNDLEQGKKIMKFNELQKRFADEFFEKR